MSSPKDLLTQFNLSEHEAEIYLATLELGTASVNDIAKKIGKSRTATYFHLDHLLKKGILKETRKGKLARFVAKSPEEMVATAEQSIDRLKETLPLLKALQKSKGEMPEIEILETKEGYKKIYETITSMPANSIYRLFEGSKAVKLELDSLTQVEWKEYLTKTIEKNIQSKALATESTQSLSTKKFTKENEALLRKRIWNLRTVPDEILPFEELMIICGSKVLVMFTDPNLVMIITHKKLANMLSLMFDGLYIQGRPVKDAWI